jgi:hypothetical protein
MSATNGLYWAFHNIQYRRHGLSRLYDNGFFSEVTGSFFFKIPCISRTTNLEGKFLSKNCGLYTSKYGNYAQAYWYKPVFKRFFPTALEVLKLRRTYFCVRTDASRAYTFCASLSTFKSPRKQCAKRDWAHKKVWKKWAAGKRLLYTGTLTIQRDNGVI